MQYVSRQGGAREAAGQREEALADYEHALDLNTANAEVAAKVKALSQALGKCAGPSPAVRRV